MSNFWKTWLIILVLFGISTYINLALTLSLTMAGFVSVIMLYTTYMNSEEHDTFLDLADNLSDEEANKEMNGMFVSMAMFVTLAVLFNEMFNNLIR